MYNKYKETPEKQIEQYHVEKQRSKQRLVGSIILLLFALLVLLAITAKIKPIAIPESTLEVHSTVIAIESQESTITATDESETLTTNTESNVNQAEAVVTNTNIINNQPQANSQHTQQAPIENNATTETTVTQFKGGIIRTNNDVTTKNAQKTAIKPVVTEIKKPMEPVVNKPIPSKIEKPKAEVKAVQQEAAPLQKAKVVAKQSNHSDDSNDDLIDSATAKKAAATAKKPTKAPTQPSAPAKPKAKKTTNPDDILNGLE